MRCRVGASSRDPPPQGQPYPSLNNIGICRIAFSVDDIDRTYEDLKAKKVECLAPLKKISGPNGGPIVTTPPPSA